MTLGPMKSHEAIEVLATHHDDEVVVTGIGAATHEWHQCVGESDQAFHVHTMGLATSVGLGLALANPNLRVWALEGDGALAINLGTILTLSDHQEYDLACFVIQNRRYGIIKGGAWPANERADLQAMASAAGIQQSFYFSALHDLKADLPGILNGSGLRFVVLDVQPDAQQSAPAPYEGPEIKYRFARYMEQKTGRSVLGELGY
jgi:sulfopyruvate decarboxylase subunit beta